jgi:hypothetical protein
MYGQRDDLAFQSTRMAGRLAVLITHLFHFRIEGPQLI